MQKNETSINEKMIPIDDEIDAFRQYLESNNRCILSAKFGDGKTYFLQQFQECEKKNYLFITIHPVNYQVAENQDIFDYIKRDILLNLLTTDGIDLDDTVIKKSLLLWGYFTYDKGKNLLDLIDFIPAISAFGINVDGKTALKNIDKIRRKITLYKDEIQKCTKVGLSTDFIDDVDLKGIYEFDPVSQLICDLIDKYRSDKKKGVVLIIEDLDRIDPAHIFRILNIFSAHLDRENIRPNEYLTTHGNNKFNLDKVITVCDFSNIENIYHHLYGAGTDFNGYINKFSTDVAYSYSLKEKMRQYIFQNLLDPKLRTYEYVCDALINRIISKYIEKMQNLRSIKSYLKKTGTRIKPGFIELQDPSLSPLRICLPHINLLTKLLEIMRRFDILDDNFFKKSELSEELKALIGICFLAVLDVKYDVPFRKLYVTYKSLDGYICENVYAFHLGKNDIIEMDNDNIKELTSKLPYQYIDDSVIKFKNFIL